MARPINFGQCSQTLKTCARIRHNEQAKGGVVTETSGIKRVVHYTATGAAGICGATVRTAPGDLVLTFDDGDKDIDCPLCRMYVKGLRAGRAGA